MKDELKLHFNKLPGDVYNSHIKLTNFQKDLISQNSILKFYQSTYTDYALESLLRRFLASQIYEAQINTNFYEVYALAMIKDEETTIQYKKDVQKVCFVLFF